MRVDADTWNGFGAESCMLRNTFTTRPSTEVEHLSKRDKYLWLNLNSLKKKPLLNINWVKMSYFSEINVHEWKHKLFSKRTLATERSRCANDLTGAGLHKQELWRKCHRKSKYLILNEGQCSRRWPLQICARVSLALLIIFIKVSSMSIFASRMQSNTA